MKISVAYIRKPRGIRGELTAVLYRPSSKSLRPGIQITLQKEKDSQVFAIEYMKSLKGRIALKLAGLDNQEEASFWNGAEVLLDREDLEPLDDDEFYHFEIEGVKVYDQDGAYVGTVKQMAVIPGNDIMIIKGDDKEIMIPFVKAIVKSVDLEKKRIVISSIEGLY
jgi:16S rRNA processing protein RimM